jgi:hypothetical protein
VVPAGGRQQRPGRQGGRLQAAVAPRAAELAGEQQHTRDTRRQHHRQQQQQGAPVPARQVQRCSQPVCVQQCVQVAVRVVWAGRRAHSCQVLNSAALTADADVERSGAAHHCVLSSFRVLLLVRESVGSRPRASPGIYAPRSHGSLRVLEGGWRGDGLSAGAAAKLVVGRRPLCWGGGEASGWLCASCWGMHTTGGRRGRSAFRFLTGRLRQLSCGREEEKCPADCCHGCWGSHSGGSNGAGSIQPAHLGSAPAWQPSSCAARCACSCLLAGSVGHEAGRGVGMWSCEVGGWLRGPAVSEPPSPGCTAIRPSRRVGSHLLVSWPRPSMPWSLRPHANPLPSSASR